MTTILSFVAGIAAAVILYAIFALTVRQGKALLKGDQDEFDRLSIPYDVAALMSLRDFGIEEEVFELTWNELKESCPNAVPYDIYIYFKNRNKYDKSKCL